MFLSRNPADWLTKDRFARTRAVQIEALKAHHENGEANPMIGNIISAYVPIYGNETDSYHSHQHHPHPAIVTDVGLLETGDVYYDTLLITSKPRAGGEPNLLMPKDDWVGKRSDIGSPVNFVKTREMHRIVLCEGFFSGGFRYLGRTTNDFRSLAMCEWQRFGRKIKTNCVEAYLEMLAAPDYCPVKPVVASGAFTARFCK